MNPKSLFGELKRRNVYKVAVAYAVVAWLLIQAASILFPTFEAPPWVMKVFVAVIVLGFPIAWFFPGRLKSRPEGIKRESEVEAGQSITHHTGRKIVGITIVVALIATALFVFQLLRPRLMSTGISSATVSSLPEKSVAVLAFDNLSDDKGSEYFSDGISEELLTVLQKIPGLRVAARTSAFSFKGKSATAQEIGQKLGVANLVEGSVRKAGETVRIAARLTKTMSGDEIWSENYTRNLKDVFAAAQKDAADWARLLIVSCARWGQKRIPESDAALTELIAKFDETAAYQIAEVYGYRNDKDHAFEWLQRAR